MSVKIKIESAYPQVRMLERSNSFAFEVWSWKVNYLLLPKDKGCKSCEIKSGTAVLSLNGMSYAKATLAKELRTELGVE